MSLLVAHVFYNLIYILVCYIYTHKRYSTTRSNGVRAYLFIFFSRPALSQIRIVYMRNKQVHEMNIYIYDDG